MIFDETLQKIFQMAFSPNEHERLAALHRLEAALKSRALHPADGLLVFRQDAVYTTYERLKLLEEKNDALERENRLLRDKLPRNEVLRAERASKPSYRWPELERLALRQIFSATTAPRGFFAKLASVVGVPAGDIGRWKEGRAPIPDHVFDRVRCYVSVPPSPRKPPRHPPLSEQQRIRALQLRAEGKLIDEIAKELGIGKRRVASIFRTGADGEPGNQRNDALSRMQRALYDAIKSVGDKGATAEELATALQHSAKDLSGRFGELAKLGLVQAIGKRQGSRGRMQKIWIALSQTVPPGAISTAAE